MYDPTISNAQMKALVYDRFGDPSEFRISEIATPDIKGDEVLIKVRAASISPLDVKLANGFGKAYEIPSFPARIGTDVSGIITAVGEDVSIRRPELSIGSEIVARVPFDHYGTVSEYTTCPASDLVLKPAALSHVKAASLPLAWTAALEALERAELILDGGVRDKTIYVTGGLSATGSALIQMAKTIFGAAQIITTASTSKVDMFEKLLGPGIVDRVIDYSKENVGQVLPARSVDFCFDIINDLATCLHVVQQGGFILSTVGVIFGPDLRRLPYNLPRHHVWIANALGAVVKYRARRHGAVYSCLVAEVNAARLEKICAWAAEGRVSAVVGDEADFLNIEHIRRGCAVVFSGEGGVGRFVITMPT